jgi:hypothetical protein
MLEERTNRPPTFGRSRIPRLTGHLRPTYLARRRALLVLLPGAIGSISLAGAGYKTLALIAALIAVLGVLGEFWLQKRRDDVFAKTVDKCEGPTNEILQAVTVYEAVRSHQLASADIARLLKPDKR